MNIVAEIIVGIILIIASFVLGGVLLPWIRREIPERRERKKRQIERRRKVLIVYDRDKKTKRRHCFWEDIWEENRGIRIRSEFRFISIADELKKLRNPALELFDNDKTDIIIVNWGAINTDPVFGSDIAQQFFEHYSPDMREWMKKGGIIVIEAQLASWGAIQKPFESFTKCFEGSEVEVIEELWEIGEEVSINEKCQQHPILKKLSDEDLKLREGGVYEKKGWFPKSIARPTIQSINEIARHKRKVYTGWFKNHSSDWEPLILSKRNGKPVMLCRPVQGDSEVGACVLTTMFIASSEFVKLIGNFIDLPDEMRKYNRGEKTSNLV